MRTTLNAKKIAAAALSAVMCLALINSCSEEIPAEPGPKDVIYKSTPFEPKGESYSYLSDVAFDGEAVNMLVTETEASGDTTLENNYLLKADLSGEVIEKLLLSSAAEEHSESFLYSGISINKDGAIYLIRMTAEISGSDTSITKTEIVSREGETETVLVDVSGKLAAAGVDTSNLYVSDFAVDDKIAYVTVGPDSDYAFNLKTGEIANKSRPVSDDIDIKTAEGDSKYEYYGYNNSTIYGYKKDYRILVADLPASGIILKEITRIIPVSDTQFLLTGYTGDKVGIEKLYILTKVAPEDVPDKSVITVAAIRANDDLTGYIAEFTASHPQYQVELKVYMKDSNTPYDDALRALNTDIIAGNVPDVLRIGHQTPYGSYARKGLFADLYPFIDKDPDIAREDFLQPLLAALETDGKLYSIAPAFSVETLIGKTSIFGEKQGQSLAELQAAAANIPGASLFGNMDRNYFIDSFLISIARSYIDEEKGVCSFDSPEFISLLEYAKSLPEPAPDAEQYQRWAWTADETGDYKNDKVLIQNMDYVVFRYIVAVEKMDFGEPITFLGFPNSSGGTGIKALLTDETAIMANAKNPDGAWEFVKGFQYYGNSFIESLGYPPLWHFPSLVSQLDIAAKNATIPPFEYNPITGERIPRRNWLGTDLSPLPNNTEADNAKMYALFDSIDGIHRENNAIINILSEEIAAYFATDKSAEETAKIIQNRATTYLEETK
ncbi:MAG: extracellular solute-binding protein [Ruminococcus sp.]|jgi:ABC-type glycerol-3-phosphate transport system substrate-binding protein|nr:extracellular solute-binding protein [Ruminococcus sp.]